MGSEITRQGDPDTALASTPEVEFALVLSRMIDSVRNDPEHLRETVYELARRKLQDQFTYEDVKDMRQLSSALEVAIRGVEAFARKADQAPAELQRLLPAQDRAQQDRAAQQERPQRAVEGYRLQDPREDLAPVARPEPPPILDEAPGFRPRPSERSHERSSAFTALSRLGSLVIIVLAIGSVVRYRGAIFDVLQAGTNLPLVPVSPAPAVQPAALQQVAVQSPPPTAKPSPPVPASYGIYAVSDDKLYELELLPGRAPDIRVAISAPIGTPSRTVLPDGHLKFIIYRRDSATNAADRAEVRVIAKVAKATNFDEAGKPRVSSADDVWVMRNISIPYRTAPSDAAPDMYEIQSESPEQPLPPGRYALILKGQAYDFRVAGDITDTRQCLERLAAVNGQFYSQCQKPGP